MHSRLFKEVSKYINNKPTAFTRSGNYKDLLLWHANILLKRRLEVWDWYGQGLAHYLIINHLLPYLYY